MSFVTWLILRLESEKASPSRPQQAVSRSRDSRSRFQKTRINPTAFKLDNVNVDIVDVGLLKQQ